VSASAVLVASGSTYRRTEAEGEADLIGAGIHFCATCDGPFYKGAANVSVIGGGNSGLEEGLFLTQFATKVTVVQALDTLTASKLLQDKVLAHPQMEVILNATVSSFNEKDGKLGSLTLTTPDGEAVLDTDAAFVFIGLDPNTEFLDGILDVDARGFIATDQMFQTSLEGVFAAGDVRAGSTKQIASAVGEGAAAAIQIRYYLDALSDRVNAEAAASI
jgi:thioredoxin reductase (NADPH)